MNKKLALTAVAGLSVFLSGCSLPGVPDQAAIEQARVLSEMQQQMATLLSGIESLRLQNEELSGMLAKVQYTEEDKKLLTPTDIKKTEEVISLFGSGFDIERDLPSSGTGISELTIPVPEGLSEALSGIENREIRAQTGLNPSPAKIDTGSVLEVLRKASMQDKTSAPSTGTK